jgi:hypothetical protein
MGGHSMGGHCKRQFVKIIHPLLVSAIPVQVLELGVEVQ